MAAFWLGDVLNLRLQESRTTTRERRAASQTVPDPAQELHTVALAVLLRALDYRATLGSGDRRLYPSYSRSRTSSVY